MENQGSGSIHLNGKLLMKGPLMQIIYKYITGENFDDTQDHQSYIHNIEDLYNCNIEGQLTLLNAKGRILERHQII